MEDFQNDIHLHTIQPYLVLKTDSFCQHLMTTYGISHFFSCHITTEKPVFLSLIPDGCSNIIFAYNKSGLASEVFGSTVNQKTISIENGTDYFGIRFLPGENPCFTNLPVKELINNKVPLADFPGMKLLHHLMSDQQTFDGRMLTFLKGYKLLFEHNKKKQHELFRQICRVINNKDGMISISELEKLTGYSARYINYIFESEAGISAKQFCRILKLQSIICCMNSGNVSSMSKIAADYHFYDQSHFIHDFENFTGMAPKEYLAEVIQKQYSRCVIDV
jgi:AraC-like DNA-binding protein